MMNDDEKQAAMRALWLAVLFVAIVIVVSATIAAGIGVRMEW